MTEIPSDQNVEKKTLASQSVIADWEEMLLGKSVKGELGGQKFEGIVQHIGATKTFPSYAFVSIKTETGIKVIYDVEQLTIVKEG